MQLANSIRYPQSLPISLLTIKSIKSYVNLMIRSTAKIHGFKDALDYYRQCSALPLLNQIKKNTLIIHAKDDPFMSTEVIPDITTLPKKY